MRSALMAACLLAGVLVLPARAQAQDPPEQPPTPAPPAAVAVPRASQPARAPDPPAARSQDNESRNRAPERAAERPAREPAADANHVRGAVRREVIDTSEQAARPAAGADTSAAAAERRGERPGSVRRPQADDRGAPIGDRAIPRAQAPRPPQTRVIYPRYRYPSYSIYFDPWGYGTFGIGYLYYAPWTWGPYYNYGYSYPRYGGTYGYDVGSVRLKVRPREAEVWVDGYYAGTVDDFDGMLQALKLDAGAYHIEVRKPGYETLTFDVRVQPDRTITFRGEMRRIP